MTRPYGTLPHEPTIQIDPFEIQTPPQDVADLKQLLRLTRLSKATYENTTDELYLGIKRDWLAEAKRVWEDEFDWQKQVDRINSLPQYLARVRHPQRGTSHTLHFAALFSRRPDALPIVFTHGWPGCFLEFEPMMHLLTSRYAEADLPYHIVVPSLTGWAYSSPPPTDAEWGAVDSAALIYELMKGLGFGEFVAQGGDIGSAISCCLGAYEECKLIHLNFRSVQYPPKGTKAYQDAQNAPPKGPNDYLVDNFQFAYGSEHGTRPATVGLVVGSNPISLLGWIGEKYLEWSDQSPSLETILTFATLYWFTDTYPSSIYTYRYGRGPRLDPKNTSVPWVSKPFGYSLFKHELVPAPVDWIAATGNMVWSRTHEDGGHFAALERPDAFWEDVHGFVAGNWDKHPSKAKPADY